VLAAGELGPIAPGLAPPAVAAAATGQR
jgi:hypothetical protein